jgi:1-acyl-sn-glycerol-3-phosphate acyltransferase
MSDGERRVYWAPPRGGVWVPIWLLARIVFRLTLLPVGRFRVAGRRRIPREGGVLVVANHLADLDPVFVGMACIPRRGQYIALAKHFTRWPLARALFGLGAFPVRPGGSDARALRYARNQLAAGRLVVIFPEGGPSWGADLGEFGAGMGVLGLVEGVRVVPAAIWGPHRVFRGWRPVGRGPVLVAFGHPVPVPTEGTRRERAVELTRRTREAVRALLEPMVRASP